MKIIIKNFISTLNRFKTASVLNILGLSIAFAAFILIMIQVDYERNFDRCHSKYKQIFRVSLQNSNGDSWKIHSHPFTEAVIASSPHILEGTLMNPYIGKVYLSIQDGENKKGFREGIVTCHPAITSIFDFQMVEGRADCLSDPEKIIIPESMAQRMFGTSPAMGKTIVAEESVWSKYTKDLVVGGVYRDFPDNTQLDNIIYTAISPRSMDDWISGNYFCFILLDSPDAASDVIDNFTKHFDFTKHGYSKDTSLKLTPLADIYYLNESQDGNLVKSGNKETTSLLIFIALITIALAAINFTNFSTSLTPLRIKSINTQKVLGSSTGMLRLSLLIEAIGISLLSYVMAIFVVSVLNQTSLLTFMKVDLLLMHHLLLLWGGAAVAMFIGLIAGVYPAYYITSFSPAMVLKGSFGTSEAGKKLRTTLIGIQFIVSIILIIGSLFVQLQNHYMQHFTLGFDKDQVAVVSLNNSIYSNHKETYVSKLKEYSGIIDVAFSKQKFGASDNYRTWGGNFRDKEIGFTSLGVSANFLSVMGVPVVSGRNATSADEQGKDILFIFNTSAQKEFGLELGESVTIPWLNEVVQIIGFTGDVKFTSLRNKSPNTAFVINEKGLLPISYIKIKAGSDVTQVVNHIRKTIKEIDPNYPFDIEFYDSIFNQLYWKEQNISKMIFLFSMLAVVISIVGVFGLVLFETQYRRKEIGIRKVHGAVAGEILYMFNKYYLQILCICFLSAVPLAYYGISKWLEGFAYKTVLEWWVFIAAFSIIGLITLATVTFQTWKVANENPVNSLKNE